jgi:hypothetical protein
MGEIAAAESIRNILAGIQADAGGYLISSTAKGVNYGLDDFVGDLKTNAVLSALSPLASLFLMINSNIGDGNGGNSSQRRTTASGDNARQFVHRGDSRHPDVIFNEGFEPRNPNGNITASEHIYGVDANGNTVNIKKDSQWVSASKSPRVAAEYSDGGWVYILKANGGFDAHAAGLSPTEKEVAFKGGIRPENILVARKVDLNDKYTGEFRRNPRFRR